GCAAAERRNDGVVSDERLRGLGDDRDGRCGTDSDDASPGQAARDHVEGELLEGGDAGAASRVDGGARARAGGCRGGGLCAHLADGGGGGDGENGDGGVDGCADGAADGATGGHRQHVLGGGGVDGDVAVGGDGHPAGDPG